MMNSDNFNPCLCCQNSHEKQRYLDICADKGLNDTDVNRKCRITSKYVDRSYNTILENTPMIGQFSKLLLKI